MNKLHKRRIYFLSLMIAGLAIASGLILYALKQNINVFLTPAQIAHSSLVSDYHFRLGGMIKPGSIRHDKTGLGVKFIVTDFKQDILVRYSGVLPDLFREGKGVIAEGSLNKQHIFIANVVLAKHDENYMPKNVYEKIKENTK